MSNPPSYNDIFENQVREKNEINKIIDEVYELKNEIKDNQIIAELYKTKYKILGEDLPNANMIYYPDYNLTITIMAIILLIVYIIKKWKYD